MHAYRSVVRLRGTYESDNFTDIEVEYTGNFNWTAHV